MKRCPQCEFIYEDDQSLCDMDGVLLVFDARTLPNLSALAPVAVPVAPKAHWRHRTFPALAALILASVFSLVYFVSTQRTAPVREPMPFSGAATTAPSAPVVTSVAPTSSDTNQTPPAAPETNAAAVTTKEDSKPAKDQAKVEPVRSNSTPAANASTAAAKKAIAKTTTTQRQPEEPKKDDSKVGSILKKTGRLLKKPFKL